MTGQASTTIIGSDEVRKVPFQKGEYKPGMYALIEHVPDLPWQDRHSLKIAIVQEDGTLKPFHGGRLIDASLDANVLTDVVRHVGAVANRYDQGEIDTITILTNADPLKILTMVEELIDQGKWPQNSGELITLPRAETGVFPKA